jgi:hypothetical protein
MSEIPTQAHRGISHRAYHKALVKFAKKKAHPWKKPTRSKRARKRTKWLASVTEWRNIGKEHECEGVLLQRAARIPVDYWATNDEYIKVVLRKRAKGLRGWDVLLPGGGFHTFKTKRAACRFIAALVEMKDEDNESGQGRDAEGLGHGNQCDTEEPHAGGVPSTQE